MATHRRQKAKSTGDMFTFPSLSHDLDFESELADQLFANGKFVIHAFPVQPTNVTLSKSMILTRATSFSSKDSLMSSRSYSRNSHNSNSSSSSNSNSTCSRARTCTTATSSRKKLSANNYSRSGAVKSTNITRRMASKEWQSRNYRNDCGNSQRWQFISPAPVLNRRSSSNRRKGGKGKRDVGGRKGVCRRFLGWLVTTCQECHAIEPSKRLKVSM